MGIALLGALIAASGCGRAVPTSQGGAVITRDDGGREVTYAGEPLYYYAGDGSVPDETRGNGIAQFGSEWYLVAAKNGAPVEPKGASGGAS
jgi:hypothetical protein